MSNKLLLDTDPPVGAPSRIAAQDATGSGVNSASATYPATPTPGNLLIAVAAQSNGSSFALTNTGWSEVYTGGNSGGSTTWIKYFYKVAGASEPTTVTATIAGTTVSIEIAIYEYGGFTGTPKLDQRGSSTGGASLTATTGSTPMTSYKNELVFAAVQLGGASTANTLSGWDSGFNARSSVAGRLFTADQVVSSTSTYSSTVTTTGTAVATAAIIASFSGSDIAPTTGDAILLEDGTSYLLLEDPVLIPDSYALSSDTSTSPLTWNHTIGNGTDRMLVVATALQGATQGTVTAVTYNGVALTKAVGKQNLTGLGGSESTLWLLPNPDQGTHTVSVTATLPTTPDFTGASMSYFNAVQSTTPDATGTGSGATAGTSTAAITTVNTGAWTIGVMNFMNNGSTTGAITSSQTVREAAGMAININGRISVVDSGAAVTAGANTVSYSSTDGTGADSRNYTIAAISLAPVRSTAGTSTTTSSITKPLIYDIRQTPTAVSKALKYTNKTTPAAKTKSLQYTTKKATALTKSLQYATKRSLNLSKGLIYDIRRTQTAITKSLKYTIKKTPTAIAKSLQYAVKRSASLTKGLIYDIKRTPSAVTKALKYGLRLTTLVTSIASYWKLDDATGTTATDAIGGNNGTWQGTLGSQWGTGKIAGDGVFNGTDNYILVGDKANLSFNTGTYTLSAWVKTTATSRQTILHKYQYTGTSVESGYYVDMLANGTIRTVYETTNANLRNSDSSITINDGNWHLITAVRPSTTGDILLYIDGVLDTGVTHAFNAGTPGNIDNTIPFAIGQSISTSIGVNNWNGQIDEVGIWSRALSASEITALYNANTGLAFPFGVFPQKAVRYTVRKGAAITKGLQYRLKVATAITKPIKYTIVKGIAITKGIVYDIKRPAAIAKAVKYTVKKNLSLTKAIVYDIRRATALNKSLKYTVYIAHSQAFAYNLKYTIRRSVAITKPLKYSLTKAASALTKNTIYTIRRPIALSKALKYAIFIAHSQAFAYSLKYTVKLPRTISKGLTYDIRRTHSAITKSLKYTTITHVALTKQINYIVTGGNRLIKALKYAVITKTSLTRPLTYGIKRTGAVTKGLQYDIRRATAIAKGLKYTVKKANLAITKSLAYDLKTAAQLSRQLKYAIRKSIANTLPLRYLTIRKPAITKTLSYAIRRPGSISKNLSYILASHSLVTKSLAYRLLRQPKLTAPLTYRLKTTAPLTKLLSYYLNVVESRTIALNLDQAPESVHLAAHSYIVPLQQDDHRLHLDQAGDTPLVMKQSSNSVMLQ